MFDFFRYMLIGWLDEFRDGDWVGGSLLLLLTIILWPLIALIILLICWMVYDTIDTSGDLSRARGTVTDTHYSAPHVTMVQSGKILIPINHPASWYATFSVPGGKDTVRISHEIFNHVKTGDQMDVLVTEGRLSHKVRVVALAR